MLNSEALLKLIHYQSDGDLHLKRPYHYSTHFDHTGALGTTICEYPASRRPLPLGYYSSFIGMVGSCALCAFSRRQHEEKWWIANMLLTIGYFGSWKFHKAENEMIGHSSSVWCDVVGTTVSVLKFVATPGKQKQNFWMMAFYGGMLWFDWGRVHMWVEHASEIKKNVIQLKRTVVTSMWAEYIPSTAEPNLMLFRKIKEVED